MKTERMNVGSAKLVYSIFGEGRVGVVIETGLGSCMAEWWHIAERLSQYHTVLLYERAGCNLSSKSSLKRTPETIARELKTLLSLLDHNEKLVLIGHAQGGLYVQQFARLYPDQLKGVILIDPLTAMNDRFKEMLTPEEFKKCGIDALSRIKENIMKTRLGFMHKAKSALLYDDAAFSPEAKAYILRSYKKLNTLTTARQEHILSHDESLIQNLKHKEGFPNIPLVLITHSSDTAVREMMAFGADKQLAQKVEDFAQALIKTYLSFSTQSVLMQAKRSGNQLHLTEPELIEDALKQIG